MEDSEEDEEEVEEEEAAETISDHLKMTRRAIAMVNVKTRNLKKSLGDKAQVTTEEGAEVVADAVVATDDAPGQSARDPATNQKPIPTITTMKVEEIEARSENLGVEGTLAGDRGGSDVVHGARLKGKAQETKVGLMVITVITMVVEIEITTLMMSSTVAEGASTVTVVTILATTTVMWTKAVTALHVVEVEEEEEEDMGVTAKWLESAAEEESAATTKEKVAAVTTTTAVTMVTTMTKEECKTSHKK